MKFIVANWKMNGDISLACEFMHKLNSFQTDNTIIICPPAGLIKCFDKFKHSIGAQNCHNKNEGAYTGENSPKLLKSLGCSYVLVGHSERRNIFNETNDVIFEKWKIAIDNSLVPIVCVGESLEERCNWKDVLFEQVKSFRSIDLNNTIFAYEPVWCIGTGTVPSCSDIEEALEFLNELLGDKTNLLYGGSVNSKNAQEILSLKHVDGLLVGGASLKIDEFLKIASAT